MELLIRNLFLSFINIRIGRVACLSVVLALCCKIFFETLLPRRRMRYTWLEYTMLPAFTAGFMLIATTRIPPYILQPVRLTVVVGVIAWCYFRAGIVKNLILALLFSAVYWMVSIVSVSFASLLPITKYERINENLETVSIGVQLCLMLLFRYRYKKRLSGLTVSSRKIFVLFPIFSIVVVMAISMMPWYELSRADYADYAGPRVAAVLGFAIMNICIFYFMLDLLEKETEIQRLQLREEHTKSRMELYYTMQQSYEKQRRYLHDYKNQLTCLQDMIKSGQIQEAGAYLDTLTGNFKKSIDYVNTNHTVVNVVLNRKYQEAADKGIAMTVVVNDLSGLTMSTEEIVTLLVNLLDNAIEACDKLSGDKVIQFKMTLESGEVVLSVRNPTAETVRIKDNHIMTSKRDKSLHGIGLLNIDEVIRKNNGTSVIKCENGWFGFSAMIPL